MFAWRNVDSDTGDLKSDSDNPLAKWTLDTEFWKIDTGLWTTLFHPLTSGTTMEISVIVLLLSCVRPGIVSKTNKQTNRQTKNIRAFWTGEQAERVATTVSVLNIYIVIVLSQSYIPCRMPNSRCLWCRVWNLSYSHNAIKDSEAPLLRKCQWGWLSACLAAHRILLDCITTKAPIV